MVPGITHSGIDPRKHVARIDNQWAIVQSVFLVDPTRQEYREARSWGQLVTGKFQEAIAAHLNRYFSLKEALAT